MPWSSYIDCYMMVAEEAKGSGEVWNSFKTHNVIICWISGTILQLLDLH